MKNGDFIRNENGFYSINPEILLKFIDVMLCPFITFFVDHSSIVYSLVWQNFLIQMKDLSASNIAARLDTKHQKFSISAGLCSLCCCCTNGIFTDL